MIVLDTHTWLWWVSNPENLSLPARKIIDSTVENDEILISSISAWAISLARSLNIKSYPLFQNSSIPNPLIKPNS